MFRQGDVLIQEVAAIPKDAWERADLVLAEGAVTGHRHEVEKTDGVKLFEREGTLYLRVTSPRAVVVHPEHGAITLSPGSYKVWRQREYTGTAGPRFVMD